MSNNFLFLQTKKDMNRKFCPLRNNDYTCNRVYVEYGHKVYCNVPLCKKGKEARDLIEYNIDKSAQHPTSEGDDIVRAYTKDKYKNQEIKNS